MKSLSVIVPTYNRAALVTTAIDSVVPHLTPQDELIVVDDGSTDDTQRALSRYGSPVRVVSQANRGVSAARNAGLRCATGEWVSFLDSDDRWLPSYRGQLNAAATHYPQAVAVVSDMVFDEGVAGRRRVFQESGLDSLVGENRWQIVERPVRTVVRHHVTTLDSFACRMEVVRLTRGFDEEIAIAEDWDFIAQVAACGPMVFCKGTVACATRRPLSEGGLSEQFERDGIYTRQCWARVYVRLLADVRLNETEKWEVRRKGGANQRSLGNLLLRAGSVREARRVYRDGVCLDVSAQSLARYWLTFMPSFVSAKMVRGTRIRPGTRRL